MRAELVRAAQPTWPTIRATAVQRRPRRVTSCLILALPVLVWAPASAAGQTGGKWAARRSANESKKLQAEQQALAAGNARRWGNLADPAHVKYRLRTAGSSDGASGRTGVTPRHYVQAANQKLDRDRPEPGRGNGRRRERLTSSKCDGTLATTTRAGGSRLRARSRRTQLAARRRTGASRSAKSKNARSRPIQRQARPVTVWSRRSTGELVHGRIVDGQRGHAGARGRHPGRWDRRIRQCPTCRD